MADRFLASVLIPCLDRSEGLAGCLDSLFDPTLAGRIEWLILLGRESGSARRTVDEFRKRIPNLEAADCPYPSRAQALNLGLSLARGHYIVPVDPEASYPPGYLAAMIDRLAETGAQGVAGRMTFAGADRFGRAAARAMTLTRPVLFGRGGPDRGLVSAYPKTVFTTLGPFDPEVSPDEQAEFELRIRRSGGRVYETGSLAAVRRLSLDPARLIRLSYRFGQGRALTAFKHGRLPRAGQRLPVAVLTGLVLSLILTPAQPWLLATWAVYLAAALLTGLANAKDGPEGPVGAVELALALVIVQLGWAVGFVSRALGRRPKWWSPPTDRPFG